MSFFALDSYKTIRTTVLLAAFFLYGCSSTSNGCYSISPNAVPVGSINETGGYLVLALRPINVETDMTYTDITSPTARIELMVSQFIVNGAAVCDSKVNASNQAERFGR